MTSLCANPRRVIPGLGRCLDDLARIDDVYRHT
jgi:hypothetical protein